VIIDSAVVRLIEMPFVRGFRTSFGTMQRKTAVVVELRTSDGRKGYGECAAAAEPTYTEETAYTALQMLVRDLIPVVVGIDLRSPEAFVARYAHVRGNRFAKAGVETAFWDLLAQERGASLADLVGGVRSRIEVGDSLGVKDSIAEMMDEVKLRLDQGYRRIKLKIQPGWDVEPTAAVRDAHPDVALTVDANAAYSLAALPMFRTLDRFDLQMIEQPLQWDDLVDHAALQAQLATPLCLDESVRSAEDARRAIQLGSCRVINVKTGRVGGVLEARRIHEVCQGGRRARVDGRDVRDRHRPRVQHRRGGAAELHPARGHVPAPHVLPRGPRRSGIRRRGGMGRGVHGRRARLSGDRGEHRALRDGGGDGTG
jgi:O-succinylbenzoate synthase